MNAAFELSGVVHLVRPLGVRVGDLQALRTALAQVPDRALFHHTRSRLLHRPHALELPPDDVSAWVAAVVQDRETAERLSYVADAIGENAATLRAGWLEVLDTLPERSRASHTAPPGAEMVLLASDAVPVPTDRSAASPYELMELLADADPSVWFWHLVEEPWEAGGPAPIVRWVVAHGEDRLAEALAEVARPGVPLASSRRRLVRRWRMSGLGRRVARAADETERERERAGREAVARLARRLRGDAAS